MTISIALTVKELIKEKSEDAVGKIGKRWTNCNGCGGHAVGSLALMV
jgi:hypothetical protein